jgi:hypothetical protein
LPLRETFEFLKRNNHFPFGKPTTKNRASVFSGGGSVGLVVLGFVVVIVFVIALGWLAIVSRPK